MRHLCFCVMKSETPESKMRKIVEKSAGKDAKMVLCEENFFCFFGAFKLIRQPHSKRLCIIIRLKQSVKKSITA